MISAIILICCRIYCVFFQTVDAHSSCVMKIAYFILETQDIFSNCTSSSSAHFFYFIFIVKKIEFNEHFCLAIINVIVISHFSYIYITLLLLLTAVFIIVTVNRKIAHQFLSQSSSSCLQ